MATTPSTMALAVKAKKGSDLCLTKGLELAGYFLNNALEFTPEVETHNLEATRPTNQSITQSALRDVSFTNVIGTAPTEFDTVGGINYTASVTGYYDISATVTWDANPAGTRSLVILVNNGGAASSLIAPSGGTTTVQSLAVTKRVVAGQIIKIQVATSVTCDINSASLQVILVRRAV
jgi:aspartyl aminopeptidase